MLTDREEKEHRLIRKRERERLRITQGDAYVSENDSEDEKDADEDDDDDYDSEQSEYDSEVRSEMQDAAVSELRSVAAGSTMTKRRRNRTSSHMSEVEITHRFNPLRYLAMNLKSQNETMTKPMPPRTAADDTPPSSTQGKAQATF